MKLKKYFLIVTLFIVSILSAQHHRGGNGYHMPKGCKIFGTVVDSITGEVIEYASISVIKADKSIETGGITNFEGEFEIEEIKPGTYNVKIEFMGFTPLIISDIKLSFQGERIKNLGEIKLQPTALELEAVRVIEDKPIFEFETDKLVYNSSEDIISDSGTAEDVLNKVPMVTVNQDGKIELRGNSNVKILLNGRPNRTGEGGKSVDNIPASLIDKVEVITAPSAKYDPDGMAGIINIILKKGKYEGLNGNIKINGKINKDAGMDEMNGFTAYGNYKGKKWNLYSSFNVNNRQRIIGGNRYAKTTYIDTTNILADSIQYIDFDFNNNSDRFGYSIQFGADYSINDHLIVNGELNIDQHLHTGENKQIYPEFIINTEDDDFDKNYDIEGFFDIYQSYDNPDQELNFSMSYDFQQDNEYKLLLETSSVDTTTIYQKINGINIDLSYKQPLNDKSIVELGYDGRINNNKETMDFQIENFNGENTFSYHRSIHGFFLEYDHKLSEKISIKPSVRYEYISKDISFISEESGDESILYAQVLSLLNDSTYIDNYQIIYPDFHVTYNITDKQSILFGLSKRVNRPGDGGHGAGSRQIRPFPRDVYSDHFLFIGNPFLKPEYSTQYDLSFKSPLPMGFGYVNLYYHQLKDMIRWYDLDTLANGESIDGDILTFKNADSGENMGIEFFTMVMGQVLGGSYNLSKVEDPSRDYELNGHSQRITLYNRINLPEKYIKFFSFEFGFFFMKMAVPGGNLFGAKGSMWANMAFSKSFLDENFEVSFGIDNLFDSNGFQLNRKKPLSYFIEGYNSGSEETKIFTTHGGRTFKLNIIYRFGKMQDEKQRGRHSGHGDGGSMDMGY